MRADQGEVGMQIEFLLEEPSAEVALEIILPKILPARYLFHLFHVFEGKQDLLKKLPVRLKGYKPWIPDDWRIIVLIDRDQDDCLPTEGNLRGNSARCRFWDEIQPDPSRKFSSG